MTRPGLDETHDPDLRSWVASADGDTDFPIQNLPFGVFTADGAGPRPCVAIGDLVLDLAGSATDGLLSDFEAADLVGPTLNVVLAWPPSRRVALRRKLSQLLSDRAYAGRVQPHLLRQSDVSLGLPARIGDYTDFYVGIHHATNVGKLFRPDNPLLANYKYVPIGYHGRASSIRASGVPVRRPRGQTLPTGATVPSFGPVGRLDFELELGLWIGQGNALGESIGIAEAGDHIAGYCLLNDWSARDVQAWEYQPLGPFLAKNFHSTISPWIVTSEALEPFRRPQPARPADDPAPLPYLWDERDQARGGLAIELEISLTTAAMRATRQDPAIITRSRAAEMYWTAAQMVTHHASNGCDLQPGDLLGTGTLSSADREGYGSLLEITEGGRQPLTLPNGQTRTFLQDGDEVCLKGRAKAEGFVPIGFGDCRATVLPAAD